MDGYGRIHQTNRKKESENYRAAATMKTTMKPGGRVIE
jgi:hypothetical protein